MILVLCCAAPGDVLRTRAVHATADRPDRQTPACNARCMPPLQRHCAAPCKGPVASLGGGVRSSAELRVVPASSKRRRLRPLGTPGEGPTADPKSCTAQWRPPAASEPRCSSRLPLGEGGRAQGARHNVRGESESHACQLRRHSRQCASAIRRRATPHEEGARVRSPEGCRAPCCLSKQIHALSKINRSRCS
jgi:hypothetical protein